MTDRLPDEGLQRTLPRDHYFSPAIFAVEKERIFAREWFAAAREATMPNAGDYLVLDVAGESVFLVRDRDGTLRGFYNVCRHRGCQLVSPGADTGAACPSASGAFAGAIRCPYHSWTYALDGDLRTAPFLEEGDAFQKSDFPLHHIGVECWGGFVFVNLEVERAASEGHTLLDQLGAAPERVAKYPLADLRVARRISYDVRANWKVILENYNECYHCAGVHPELCQLVPDFRRRGGADLDWERGIPHRDGAWTFTKTGTTTRAPFPGLSEDERTRHKGELLYPNFMLSLSADHAAAFTLWPHAPDRTTVVCDFLFHPDEIRKSDFDPADAVEFWDLVNAQDWAICEAVQRGMASRRFEYGYYAPMESWSLDIRRYVGEKLGTSPFPAPLDRPRP